MKNWLIVVVLVPLLAAVAFRGYMFAHRSDIGPIDDLDLLLIRPDIAPEDNAYPVFASATNVLHLPEEYKLNDFLWGDTNEVVFSHEQIVALLETNTILIATISTGLNKEFCFRDNSLQAPILAREFSQMHTLLLTKVKVLLDAGKLDDAFDAALSSLRFGYLIQKDAEYIIEALSGIAMIQRSLIFIEKIIEQYKPPAVKRLALIEQLSNFENLRLGMENGYKGEYLVQANEVTRLLEFNQTRHKGFKPVLKIISKDYVFKPNATKKILADRWRRQIYNLNHPECVKVQQGTRDYEFPEGFLKSHLFCLKENSVGKIFLFVTAVGDFSGAHDEIYSAEIKVLELKKKLSLDLMLPE